MSGAPVRVLELRSVLGTGGGPEKTILLGASRSDPAAFAITVCYLRDARDRVFAVGDQGRALGIDYVEIAERSSFDPSIWPQLTRLVRARQIDIVHAHEYKTDLLAWMLARREGVVPLATVHGWTGHLARERYFYYPLDKRLLRRFPRLIAVSSQIRSELIRSGIAAGRIATVLNGIDPVTFSRVPAHQPDARAALGLAPDDIVIGSVGRLEPQKRFDVLMESVARLAQDWPRLRLMIAGEGSERDALEATMRRLGIEGRCRLLGHRTDVVSLHHAFDLFVQSSAYEGTPNAVLEAMALETPVVATDVGGTAELARPDVDGLIVPPGDVEALTSAISVALTRKDDTSRRTASARRRVETDLSFDARAATIERVYRDLIEERARARGVR